MRKETIGTCPVCSGKLLATRLTCNACSTEIHGEFELSRFSYLTREELAFIETFIKCQGNLKDVQNVTSLSYPTVKKAHLHATERQRLANWDY